MSHDSPNEKPLQGWKEIAAYLERDVRTAVRWEKRNGLPVRRHGGAKGSSVYAYPSEIEAWRTGRPADPGAAFEPPLWRRPTSWAALGLSLAAALVIAYGPILNPRSPVAEAAEDSMRAEQMFSGDNIDAFNKLSTDGARMSFVDWSTGDLAIRDLSTGEVLRVTAKGSWEDNASFAESSVLSPDGSRIAYSWHLDENGVHGYQLRVGPASQAGAGAHGAVVDAVPENGNGYIEVFAWLDDSRILFVKTDEDDSVRLLIADVDRKAVAALMSLDWFYPEGVAVSPDGAWIAYGLKPDRLEPQNDVFVLATDGSQASHLLSHPADETPLGWSPDGRHLLFRSRRSGSEALWAIAVAEGESSGPPRLVSSEVAAVQAIGFHPNGDFYYLKRSGTRDIYEAQIDLETGRVEKKPTMIAATFAGANGTPVYSPDGRSLAYLSNRTLRRYGDRVVVVRDLAAGRERDLRPSVLSIRSLVWAPDSQSLLFRARDRKGRVGVYRFALDGQDADLLFQERNVTNIGWTYGAKIHYRDTAGLGAEHRLFDLKTGTHTRIPLPKGNAYISALPGSSRMAVVDHQRDLNIRRLLTLDTETGKPQELLRLASPESMDISTQWSPDGESLLVWRYKRSEDPNKKPPRRLWAVRADGSGLTPTGLTVDRLGDLGFFSLHPDGRRLAYAAGSAEYEIWKLSNFLDRLGASD